jgi:hypothetical protein
VRAVTLTDAKSPAGAGLFSFLVSIYRLPARILIGMCAGAFSSEVDTGSREETRQNKNLELRF